MRLDVASALAWRLQRQALEPRAEATVTDLADRVVATRAWPAEIADHAFCVRQAQPEPGALSRAMAAGEIICSYTFRGGAYVFTPQVAAVLLRVRGTTRVWESSRFQRQGRFALDDWEPFREAMAELLQAGPATRAQIGAHLSSIPALRHLATGATGVGSDSLYKPLHWWGDICFGPTRDGQSTFRLLSDDARWPGLPDLDEAGRAAVVLYLGTYGPATIDNLQYWLTAGLSVPRRRLRAWIADLGDDLAEVSLDGVPAYALAADLDELSTARASESVRLLPAYDPWILGPGTADRHLLDPARRALVSRGAGLVILGGVVSGTWRLSGEQVAVSWFDEAGLVPTAALEDEVQRLAGLRPPSSPLRLTLA